MSGFSKTVFDKLVGYVLYAVVLGLFYPLVVGAALAVCIAVRPSFRPPPLHWLALAVPWALYYALEIVKSRQSLSMVGVVPVLAIVAVVGVVVASVSDRSIVMPIAAAADSVLAVVLWRRVRMFMPRMF